MKSKDPERLFSRVYDPLMAPLETLGLREMRRDLLRELRGETLEIGFGTGLNFPHYPPGVSLLTGIEPDPLMLEQAKKRAEESETPIRVIQADAQALPFEDGSFDRVVATLAFCTIPNPQLALAEANRVLRPGGSLHLLEHVRMENDVLARLQSVATPLWKHLAGGCHLDRDTLGAVREAGFSVERVERYLDGLVLSIAALKPTP